MPKYYVYMDEVRSDKSDKMIDLPEGSFVLMGNMEDDYRNGVDGRENFIRAHFIVFHKIDVKEAKKK